MRPKTVRVETTLVSIMETIIALYIEIEGILFNGDVVCTYSLAYYLHDKQLIIR